MTKINAAGTAILYSTFLGGGGDDQGFAIAVDGAGNAYVTGQTNSTAFPGVAISDGSIQPHIGGGYDAFVTKINSAGSAILYSTFLGGAGDDVGTAIAVDAAGNAYVTGVTGSTTFPGVTGSSMQPAYGGGPFDAFVTKINAVGSAILYSTFLGGSGDDEAFGIAIDGAGNAYVTGLTHSATFPGAAGSSIQPANGGGWDAFATKLDATGTAIELRRECLCDGLYRVDDLPRRDRELDPAGQRRRGRRLRDQDQRRGERHRLFDLPRRREGRLGGGRRGRRRRQCLYRRLHRLRHFPGRDREVDPTEQRDQRR